MTTFALSEVARGPRFDALDADAAIRSLLLKPVEAMTCPAGRLVSCETSHAFAKAAHDAFYLHHPLTIRPDDLWFCVMQGLAQHLALHGEDLRDRVVAHQGKKKLVVARPDFFLGQPNPWPEVFESFSQQVAANVGSLGELAGVAFSTSTPIETAAFDVCLMDAFQGYFEYEIMAGCGIPEVTIRGTEADWQRLRSRLALLRRLDLGWWVDALDPVVARLAETAAGHVALDFWRSFFRYESGSMGSQMTGWIQTFFPYLVDERAPGGMCRNDFLVNWHDRFQAAMASDDDWRNRRMNGPSLGRLPGSLASAPVRFVDARDGAVTMLRFVGGMFGVSQDADDGSLAAAFGWAVVHDIEVSPPPRKDVIHFDFDENGQLRNL